jgi:hypothetical protein
MSITTLASARPPATVKLSAAATANVFSFIAFPPTEVFGPPSEEEHRQRLAMLTKGGGVVVALP